MNIHFRAADGINSTAVAAATPLPVAGGGTAGSPAAGVTTIQGIAGGTPVPVDDKMIDVAFATLTRPANVTAYSVNDSISNDNVAVGNVTAIAATVSDSNDMPVLLTELRLDTNDTGLAAGVQIRAWLFSSDPTANSGVGAVDNAAWSNKRAGFIGTLSGTFRAFSDGGRARLVPDEGSFIIALPATGARTFYVQYQTLTAFTPSASSTTIDARLKGIQGRA